MRVTPKIVGASIILLLLFAFIYVPNVVEAASQDNNVEWNGVYYDSRDSYYRSPLGSYYKIGSVMGDLVHPDENVIIRIRVYENDVTAVKLRIWKSYAASEQVLDMTKENADGTYEWWKVTIPAPNTIENYYYFFQLIDGTDYDCYSDDSVRDGGVGQMYDANWTPGNDYLLAYRSAATDIQSRVVYQIMPDRFFDGDNTNNNPSESPGLYDSSHTQWRMYWGGDLEGIRQKVSYLREMGITAVWIAPVVNNMDELIVSVYDNNVENEAPYHGYHAKDFFQIEEHFGDWDVWDNLVQAFDNEINIILDFAPNHTNPADLENENFAEAGALYENGVPFIDYFKDGDTQIHTENENNFHHYGGIDDWTNRAEAIYLSFPSLIENQFIADLNQINPTVDSYLKVAMEMFLNRGVSGFRIDAVKSMEAGWLKSLADNIYANKNVYLVGEWWEDVSSNLWWNMVKFGNTSGINLNNHALKHRIRNVFALNQESMQSIEDTITKIENEIRWNEKMFVFFDTHDLPRFLSLNGDKGRFHQAMVLTLTTVGIPVMYYGDEQYLHDNTQNPGGESGGDPHNRPMMENWDTSTTAYKIIQRLSRLRQDNPAIRYGLHRQRWINENVYVYERKFFNDVVLVAINKSVNTSYTLSGLYTALPSGTYPDHLGGLLGGGSITVSDNWSETEQGYLVSPAPVLDPYDVAVWHYIAPTPSAPQIGAIDPTVGRQGNLVKISGKGFGENGTVYFENETENVAATVVTWSDGLIKVNVPAVGAADNVQVFVSTAGGDNSNKILFSALNGRQVPVMFRIVDTNGTPLQTQAGEQLWITGNIAELGKWSTDSTRIVGPMVNHENVEPWDNWRVVASLPAGKTIEFKFIRIKNDNTVAWESGSNRVWTVPSQGTQVYVAVADNTASYSIRADSLSPAIENLKANPTSFSPSQGEKTLISFILSEVVENRTIRIENSTNGLINTFVGSGIRYVTQYWDGRDNIGNIVPADNYTIKVNATDYAGNNATENTTIVEVV